ncbi:MAG: hypothetical protein HYY91_01285 [Candidatus Omnitrophica bacterium]|nr:hypothetical protein [Candidatus Omnitrophota bacterium]
MPQRRLSFLCVCLLALLGAVPAAQASQEEARRSRMCPICRTANDQDAPYPRKTGMRFVRGAVNTAFGWTELLSQPAEEVKSGGNVFEGVTKGFGRSLQRTGIGIGELFTCWIPKQQQGPPKPSDDCPICMGITPPQASKTSPPENPPENP